MKIAENVLGIVLRAESVKETDIRLHILTKDGIIRVNANGARKPTAKLKAATQLFTVAEFSVTGHRLIGAHVLLPVMNITKNINRYYLACSICEILLEIKNHDAAIFTAAIRAMESLCGNESAYVVFINFFAHLLELLGYGINIKSVNQNELTLTDAKKIIKEISKAFIEHLDISISCIPHFLN